ncbi:MAG: bifunctional UDP-N-acetylglucosamine diphosphorylase/glucosamine-1-phosphate N-acetyltransferase GlmU [Nitrospirae bacterium]|nr:bifunctional UDP-N-acetylglucosamine diphosphorylase/glucosamine-1-phosphate N-acetyltransferase GlmU [Nitrospirota bacterium]
MKTACVILAAGLGTRMKSGVPKVLHRICGAPMLQCVIKAAEKTGPEKIVVVAGMHLDRIKEAVGAEGIAFALQDKPLGTGHALRAAVHVLRGFRGDLLVINGDTPLIRPATLKKLLSLHKRHRNDVSFLSFIAGSPEGYGRVIRDKHGKTLAVVEEKDADQGQKSIREVNSGVYVISSRAVHLLDKIPVNPVKGEYYLTDIVSMAARGGFRTSAFCIGEEDEFMGINTTSELARAQAVMRRSIVDSFTEDGVLFIDPDSVYIDLGVSIEAGAVIYPNVYLEGGTRVGRGSVIYPNARIKDGTIGREVTIKDSSVIENSSVKDNASIGPFAHIRPGCLVGAFARVGNFVELKKTVLGKSSKASHLSYLGDAVIGKDVNIGAGTITCNYDGRNKHLTVIEDGVFIGSDTQLVAPVKVSKGSYVGAGSTITKDVPRGSLAISRVHQKNVEGWAKRKKR